jgi:O-antigen/teichoic acid export membrane protein
LPNEFSQVNARARGKANVLGTAGDPAMEDLKQLTAHGAFISIASQAANFVFRTGSMIVLARLLLPKDFGLVGMVTAFTGFLGLFRDAGLGLAAVQRASITPDQCSTLFWVNLTVGGVLAALCVAAAPILVTFYGEPRLFWVSVALGTSFLFNGVAAQHRAMLQRGMDFGRMALVDLSALLLSTAAAVAGAAAGFGYWALVIMATGFPLAAAAGAWLAHRWVPGIPRRGVGIRSMIWFGGTVTLNGVIIYLAYNIDKVLIGRFFGAEALGIYGRAYQLTSIPTDNLQQSLGTVALPGLSRVQNDPERQRRFFLKGYSLYLSLVLPITTTCALFADDIILVLLGPRWSAAATIFRLLAPTILAFAFLNPLAWLMLANGQANRGLKISFMVAPAVILGDVIGLTYGPHGVAAGFSIAMVLLIVPCVAWVKFGTLITWDDIIKTVGAPFISVAVSSGVVYLLVGRLSILEPALLRLSAETAVLFATYLVLLLFVFRQWAVYTGLFRETGLWKSAPRPEKAPP